jgi:hypothetical protein
MLAACLVVLTATLRSIGGGALTAAWNNVGFGQFDPVYLASAMPGIFDRRQSLLGTIVLANLPQMAVALSYIAVSRLLTVIARIKASMPLWPVHAAALAAFALLQWFVSQSLFPVRFQWYDSNATRRPEYDVVSEGYSFRAIVASFVLYFAIILVAIALPLFDRALWRRFLYIRRVARGR